MAIKTVSALQMQAWISNSEKQLILNSNWAQMSNRVVPTSSIPNSGTTKVSDSVIMNVSQKFTRGIFKATVPSTDKLKGLGLSGWAKAEGKEETPERRYMSVYFNVQRKPISLKDDTVDGFISDGYNDVGEGIQMATDFYAEQDDYDYTRTVLELAPEHITEASAWEGSVSIDSVPFSSRTNKLHPNIICPGIGDFVTWSSVKNTYLGNINTALASVTAGTKMSLTMLNKIAFIASKSVKPLGSSWKSNSGNTNVKWVLQLTPAQAFDLTSDTAWQTLMKDAEDRGVQNRALSGVLGIYRNMLILENQRSPLYKSATTAANSTFEYCKPGDNDLRVPVQYTVTGTYNNVTWEVAMLLGQNAIGATTPEKLKFVSDKQDYEFSEGMDARRMFGAVRADFMTAENQTVKPKNWSSFVFLTPSNTWTV